LRPALRFFVAAFFAVVFLAVVFFAARFLPAAVSFCARLRVAADVVPFFGGGTSSPARRALDKPMAIACFGFLRRPFFSSCISSRTYSLAFDEDVFRPDRFLVEDRFDVEAFFCAMLTSFSIELANSLFTVDSLRGHFVSWK
jgi:hypothetical protein